MYTFWNINRDVYLTVARQDDIWTQKFYKSNPKKQEKVCHSLSQILKNPRRHRKIWNPVVTVAPFEERMLEVWVLDGGNKWRDLCVTQLHPTLCDPMNLPGSSVHGILKARMLEWFAIPFSRGSFQSRDQTHVSHIAGRFFTSWSTRESPHIDEPQMVKWCTEGHISH